MRMLEVLEPTSNGRIEIGYDFFDALPPGSPSLDTNFILKLL